MPRIKYWNVHKICQRRCIHKNNGRVFLIHNYHKKSMKHNHSCVAKQPIICMHTGCPSIDGTKVLRKEYANIPWSIDSGTPCTATNDAYSVTKNVTFCNVEWSCQSTRCKKKIPAFFLQFFSITCGIYQVQSIFSYSSSEEVIGNMEAVMNDLYQHI